jgi:hypothetical protein
MNCRLTYDNEIWILNQRKSQILEVAQMRFETIARIPKEAWRQRKIESYKWVEDRQEYKRN